MTLVIEDNIFLGVEEALEFLKDNEIIPEVKACDVCNSTARLLIYKDRTKTAIIYRCTLQGVRHRRSIFSSTLSMNIILRVFYLILLDTPYRQLYLQTGVAKATISKYKKILNESFKKYMREHPVFVGGLGVIVEVDETVICRRGVIRNPSNTDDNRSDTIWIVGGIDNTPQKNFFLSRVQNRRITTLSTLLESNLLVGSILFTDGYPSYPQVAENLNLDHTVVPHQNGFVTEDGLHTNNIEGFWSDLKAQLRRENGVKRANIDEWLISYTFKRRYLKSITRNGFAELFVELLKIVFN